MVIRLSGFTGVNLLDGTFISSPELLKVQWKVMGGGLDCTPHTREIVSCFKAPTTWVDDPSLHTGVSENSSGRGLDAEFNRSPFFDYGIMTIDPKENLRGIEIARDFLGQWKCNKDIA